LRVVLSPTNEGFGHAQRAEAIASRLVGLKGIECLVFSDRVRAKYLSKLNLKCKSSLHGINYVYRRNGDLNTLPTFFRLILDLPYFPLDFLRAVTLSRGYDVFVNDYNPHLTIVPGVRTINISHYLPYKYRWSDLRMNFYSTLVERPIVYGERLRSLLRLSESFVMDIRPELVDYEKVFPPIARDVTRPKSQVRRELGLHRRDKLVMVTGRPYHNEKGGNEYQTYRKIAHEHPDLHFLIGFESNPSKLDEKMSENLRFTGYIKDIQNYINASDLIITRAGFGTISEAVVYGVPLLVFLAKEHMEKRKNALMVQDYGYGKIVENLKDDVVHTLEETDYRNHDLPKLGNGLDYLMRKLLHE